MSTTHADYRAGHEFGTRWTEAGRGATVGQLLDAFERYRIPTDPPPVRLATHKRTARTNLELLGNACDEQDLTRIRSADCQGTQDEACSCWLERR